MPSSKLLVTKRVNGYPQQLCELLADVPAGTSELVAGLFVLLRQGGMNIAYSDVDVLCGHATQFLYAAEYPECLELAVVPPVETLFKHCAVEWKESIPSGMDAAFDVILSGVHAEKVTLGRLKRPLLFFGGGGEAWERQVAYAELRPGARDVVENVMECERKEWRYPLDDANTFISILKAPRQVEGLKELCHVVAQRAVRTFRVAELATGVAAGEAAYRWLIDEFSRPKPARNVLATFWREHGLKVQWLSRGSLADFFERNAPRFGGAERKAFDKASFYYRQCFRQWQAAEATGKLETFVSAAADWEKKAVNELLRVVA